jgi:hypothetical protein
MSTSTETKNAAPAFDDLTTKCLATPFTDWHPNLMACFVDRIEDAFREKLKGPMVEVHDRLSALLEYVMSTAPEEARRAVLDDKGDPAIRAAYLLGRLSFAEQFTGHVAHHRPDDQFYEEFNDKQTRKILDCLTEADSTKAEMSTRAGMALATLHTKLKVLTGLGITDFRHRFTKDEQGVAEYFLTSAAKQMLAQPRAA